MTSRKGESHQIAETPVSHASSSRAPSRDPEHVQSVLGPESNCRLRSTPYLSTRQVSTGMTNAMAPIGIYHSLQAHLTLALAQPTLYLNASLAEAYVCLQIPPFGLFSENPFQAAIPAQSNDDSGPSSRNLGYLFFFGSGKAYIHWLWVESTCRNRSGFGTPISTWC